MKILLVQESDWLKRNPHQQHHLMEKLSLKGNEIMVIDYPIDWKKEKGRRLLNKTRVFNDVSKIYPGSRIQVIRPSSIRLPVLEYIYLVLSHRRQIRRAIKVFKPDVIVGLGILNAHIASGLARAYHIPFSYYWIDLLHLLIREKPARFVGKLVEKRTIRNSTAIITINKKLEDYVVDMGADRDKMSLIGAGIDTKRFDPGIDGSKIRAKYGVGEDDILLFFMGWLYHFSGIKEVALEIARGNERYRNVKLLIAGDGDAYDSIKTIVDSHDLQDRVLLTGKLQYDSIPEHISAADICILPARPDEVIMQYIVPIKMYEYMAMEKPVISTRLPGIEREFGNDNGIVYVDSPEETLAMAVELKSSGNIKRLGRQARNFAARYEWDDILEKFECVLDHQLVRETQREAQC